MKIIETTNLFADRDEQEARLDELIEKANALVRQGKAYAAKPIKEQEKEVRKVCEVAAAAELINALADKDGNIDDTAAKVALCKARWFSTWVTKEIKETGCLEKVGKQVRFDITDLLERYGIDTSYKTDIQILGLYLTLAASDLVDDEKKNLVSGSYKLDRLARQKFETGVDPLSNRQTVKAVQTAIDSFNVCSYKAVNADWQFFLLAVTQRDTKATNGIKMLAPRRIAEVFYDVMHEILVYGRTSYSIDYKRYKNSEVAEPAKVTGLPTAEAVPAAPTEGNMFAEVLNKAKKPAAKKTTAKKTTAK